MFLMFQLERPDVLAVGDLHPAAIERAYDPMDCRRRRRSKLCRAVAVLPYFPLAAGPWRSLQNEPG